MSLKSRHGIGCFCLLAMLAGWLGPAVLLPPPAVAAPPSQATVTFEGGPGDTPATAVIIRGASNGFVGVEAEYRYLQEKFGQRNRDWRLTRQALLRHGDRMFDVMHLELATGARRTVYFDITDFFGKK